MIGYICGTVDELFENRIILDNGGIGYIVFASAKTIDRLAIGEKVKLFTYLDVKEDALNLFGFFFIEEKEMFLKLINVSGIGAKVAVSILSGLSVAELSNAILSADTSQITRVKGIGKKTAERMVLELKDKVSGVASLAKTDDLRLGFVNDDAVNALISLGFTKQESMLAVSKVATEGMKTEDIVMQALKGGI